MPRPSRLAVALALLSALTAGLHGVGSAGATRPDPSRAHLYVGGAGSSGLVGLDTSGDGVDGVLPGSPYATGHGSLAVKGSADGRFVYQNVALPIPEVVALRRDSDGSLSRIGSAVVPGVPLGLGVSPDGRRLYVTLNSPEYSVQAYDLDAAGLPVKHGGPVALGQLPSVDGPVPMPAVAPDGRSVYVTGFQSGEVIRLGVRQDGTLTQPQQRIKAGSGSVAPTISPDGRFLFVSNENSNDLSGFRITRTGALEPVPGSPFPAGGGPHYLSFTNDSRYLYVPNVFSNDVHAYAVRSDGSLREVVGSPFAHGAPGSTPANIAVAPDDSHLHLVTVWSGDQGFATIKTYRIESGGGLVDIAVPAFDTGVVFAGGPVVVTFG